MKKAFACFCVLLLLCHGLGAAAEEDMIWPEEEIDLDLTRLSGTIAYAQIYQMLYDPAPYLGQVIRMSGWYGVFEDQEAGLVYFTCYVPDVSACCAQGIEFVWAGDHAWPEDYPEPGSDVTVTGRLEAYEEDGWTYLHLVDAQVEWGA